MKNAVNSSTLDMLKNMKYDDDFEVDIIPYVLHKNYNSKLIIASDLQQKRLKEKKYPFFHVETIYGNYILCPSYSVSFLRKMIERTFPKVSITKQFVAKISKKIEELELKKATLKDKFKISNELAFKMRINEPDYLQMYIKGTNNLVFLEKVFVDYLRDTSYPDDLETIKLWKTVIVDKNIEDNEYNKSIKSFKKGEVNHLTFIMNKVVDFILDEAKQKGIKLEMQDQEVFEDTVSSMVEDDIYSQIDELMYMGET